MKRAALAVLAGTVGLVAWGMIFWAVLAPRLEMFHTLPVADEVTRALQAGNTPSGTYWVPWPRDTPESFARFVARHKAGSFFQLSYLREGVDPESPGKILGGTAQYATVAMLAVALLLLARAGSFRRRFALVLIAGLLGSDFISLAGPIWFHLPWDAARGQVLYELVSWIVLAGTTAGIVKGP